VLEKGVIHMNLRAKDVLPFLTETEGDEGGFGKVWRVEIHPSCQRLLPELRGDASGGTSVSTNDTDETREVRYSSSKKRACLKIKQGVVIARKALKGDADGVNERQILDLLGTLNHPNIVEFLGSYTHLETHNLLFPYIEMDLRKFLLTAPPMDSCQVYAGMHGLSDALSHIHHFIFRDDTVSISKIGYHHDLRPANILIKDGIFMIADFGLSKLKQDDQDSKSLLRGGHDDYLGPEAFNEADWTNCMVGRALDVWALGCTFAELACFIEGRSVQEFRSARLATHGSPILIIDNAFHLDGRIRPAVSRWLSDLASSPIDQHMGSLVNLILEMLNPNHYMRINIQNVTLKLFRLACQSIMDEVDQQFEASSYNGSDRKAEIHVFILLEHQRYIVWRSALERSSYEVNLRSINTMHPKLAKLQCILKSAAVCTSISRICLSETESLLQDLCTAVDSVCSMPPVEAHERREELWSKRVCEIQNIQILAAIRAAPKPERYKSVGINAAMKYMSLAISQSIRVGGRSRYIDAGCVDVDQTSSTISLDMLGISLIEDRSRTMGHYTGDGGKIRVMIEWKQYDVRWQDSSGLELHETMDKLVNLLDPNETPREGVTKERVLNCIGYFHDQRNHRFGFVYNLSSLRDLEDPNNALLYSANNVIRMTDPEAKPESIRPDLGIIFRLAKDLSSCLLAFHSAGWYHKNISSHHVLVFSPASETVHEHISSAVLAGFNDSRLEVSGITLGPNQELQYYHHPLYRPGTEFRHSFDYFSLGIVLLELGMWCPVSTLRYDHPEITSAEQFRLKLLTSYVSQLGEKMGSVYRDAVHFCLDAEEQIQSVQESIQKVHLVQEMFREKVVEALSYCFA
jgi:serine/threonine protein kinase